MPADAGPVEEGLKAAFAYDRMVEIMVVTERSWASVKLSIPYVFSAYNDTTKTIATNGCHSSLQWSICWKMCVVPFPRNGVWAMPLKAEGRDARGTMGEVCKEALVDSGRREDIVLQEENPRGAAEGGEGLVDACTGTRYLTGNHFSWKVREAFEANREWEIRVLSVIGAMEPRLDSVTKGGVLGRIDNHKVCACMWVGLLFEEVLCQWPHPLTAGEGEAEGGIDWCGSIGLLL